MSALEGKTSLLRKQIPYMAAFPIEGGLDWSIQFQGGGWEIVVNDNGINYAVWRGYFDIAGYNADQLTTFVSGAGWQESDEWFAGPPTSYARPRIKTWDIISKAHINDAAFSNHGEGSASAIWLAPGFAGSNYNLEEIFAGRYRHFDYSTTITAGFNKTYEQLWGAGDATAAERIYITRIIQLSGVATYPLELLTVPPQDVIVPVATIDEKDLVYIERLRRSFVEAQSRD